MSENGTGMITPPNSEPSGAVNSNSTARKKPAQGTFRSGVRPPTKIDTNRHGIRRETTLGQKKTRPKKV